LEIEGSFGWYGYRFNLVEGATSPAPAPVEEGKKKVRLVVTAKDIDEGHKHNRLNYGHECPMALALKRAIKPKYHKGLYAYWDKFELDGKEYTMPDWKNAVKVTKQTFHRYVELPVKYLR
jgi:hypothetical protein